ncbi:MAG TPA: NfeD family protein [Bacteroidales bacterium]|nr:NfeD family protein [Bacteroidales bacterium]
MEPDFFMRPDLFWFLLGLVFLLLELIVPGLVLIFFGLGAWITSLVCLIGDPGLDLQIIIFSITSILSLILLRRMLKNKFFKGSWASPATLEEEFLNREAIALTSFKQGAKGKVEFKGTSWIASAEEDIVKGQTVIITGKESIVLIVKPKN